MAAVPQTAAQAIKVIEKLGLKGHVPTLKVSEAVKKGVLQRISLHSKLVVVDDVFTLAGNVTIRDLSIGICACKIPRKASLLLALTF